MIWEEQQKEGTQGQAEDNRCRESKVHVTPSPNPRYCCEEELESFGQNTSCPASFQITLRGTEPKMCSFLSVHLFTSAEFTACLSRNKVYEAKQR